MPRMAEASDKSHLIQQAVSQVGCSAAMAGSVRAATRSVSGETQVTASAPGADAWQATSLATPILDHVELGRAEVMIDAGTANAAADDSSVMQPFPQGDAPMADAAAASAVERNVVGPAGPLALSGSRPSPDEAPQCTPESDASLQLESEEAVPGPSRAGSMPSRGNRGQHSALSTVLA